MTKKNSQSLKEYEEDDTIAVADFLRLRGVAFCHIPNEGKRSPRVGALLKKQGLQKGFPDFMIYEPRGGFHGLALELKTPTGTVSKEQKYWLRTLAGKGYAVTAAFGVDEAMRKIDRYLALSVPEKETT